MGLYSELFDTERILKSVEQAKNILMITCPGCACESISYAEQVPNRALEQGKDMEHSALAIHMVRDRLDAQLREQGKNLSHISVAFPCELTDQDVAFIKNSIGDNDCIAVLACSSGYIGINVILQDVFDGKLVALMKTTGSFVFRLVNTEDGLNNQVDREGARIIRFNDKQRS